jgi:tetratricopeptide (TPR) repeat protein
MMKIYKAIDSPRDNMSETSGTTTSSHGKGRSSSRGLVDLAARRFRQLDYEGALKAFDEADAALELQKSRKDNESLRAQVLQGRGLVRFELGDLEMALADLQEAETLCHYLNGNHLVAQARILVNIAKCKEEMRDFDGMEAAHAEVSRVLNVVEERDLLQVDWGTVQTLRQWLKQQRSRC